MNEVLVGCIDFFNTQKPTIEFRKLLASIASDECVKIENQQDCAECVLDPFLDALNENYFKKSNTARPWGIRYVRHTICEAKDSEKQLHINFNEVQNLFNLSIPPSKQKSITFEELVEASQGKEYYPDDYQSDFLVQCPKPHRLYWQSHVELSDDVALFAIKRLGFKKKAEYNNTPVILPVRFRALDLNAIICGSNRHYWCFAKRNDDWYKFDDQSVKKMDMSTIIQEVKSNCVLILYENTRNKRLDAKVFGIPNGGNFCYQNAALQLLYTSPNLKSIIYDFAKPNKKEVPKEIPSRNTRDEIPSRNTRDDVEPFLLKMKTLNTHLDYAIRAIQSAWEDEIEDNGEYFFQKKPLKDHRDDLKHIESLIEKHIAVHDKEVELFRAHKMKRQSVWENEIENNEEQKKPLKR